MSVGNITLRRNLQLWHLFPFLQRRVRLSLAMKHWGEWLGRVSHGGSYMITEKIARLDSKQKSQMCISEAGGTGWWWRSRQLVKAERAGKHHWHKTRWEAWADSVECSLGTGLLGDTILEPVSGTDLWKNPSLQILTLTCPSVNSHSLFSTYFWTSTIFLSCSTSQLTKSSNMDFLFLNWDIVYTF